MRTSRLLNPARILAAIAFLAVPLSAGAVVIDTGSRTESSGVTAGGNWANGFVVQWSITNEGPLGYTYTYSFTSDGATPLVGQPSHLIIEVSQNAPNALYKVGESYLTPQIWGTSSGNPGLTTEIYGIKLDFGEDTYSFESTQAPMWGDFYSKDGEAGGYGQNYAFNTGIGTDPGAGATDFTAWIRVPDTTTSVPEPGTALLLGTGLVMMAGLGRRKLRK